MKAVVHACCALLVIVSIQPSNATVRLKSLEGIDSCNPLENSHLIVRGTVRDVSLERITLRDFGVVKSGDPGAETEMPVSIVRVEVAEVLKGRGGKGLMRFVSTDGSWMFQPAKEYIICANRQGPRDAAFFLIGTLLGLYEKSNDGQWALCRSDPHDKLEIITDDKLRSRVRETGLDRVTKAAEVVARGTITGMRVIEFDSSHGAAVKMNQYDLRIDETLKGARDGDVMRFVVPIVNPVYVPSWYRCVPGGIAPGQEWLVFLRKGKEGLYPFAGRNSLLKIEGDRLLYDMRVESTYTLERARQIIRSEESHDAN